MAQVLVEAQLKTSRKTELILDQHYLTLHSKLIKNWDIAKDLEKQLSLVTHEFDELQAKYEKVFCRLNDEDQFYSIKFFTLCGGLLAIFIVLQAFKIWLER